MTTTIDITDLLKKCGLVPQKEEEPKPEGECKNMTDKITDSLIAALKTVPTLRGKVPKEAIALIKEAIIDSPMYALYDACGIDTDAIVDEVMAEINGDEEAPSIETSPIDIKYKSVEDIDLAQVELPIIDAKCNVLKNTTLNILDTDSIFDLATNVVPGQDPYVAFIDRKIQNKDSGFKTYVGITYNQIKEIKKVCERILDAFHIVNENYEEEAAPKAKTRVISADEAKKMLEEFLGGDAPIEIAF